MRTEAEKQAAMMVDILSHIVEFRNGESGEHVTHVRVLTRLLLEAVAEGENEYHLTPEEIDRISLASAIHDIGKIAISSEILNKPGRLKPEEYSVIKDHAMIGGNMLRELPMYQDEPLVKTAYEICRWHHERYDGSGYPDGLRGEEIPLSAQVVALADVYDALTSDRVYKKSYSHEEAARMLLEGKGGAFNPVLLEALRTVAPKFSEALQGVSATSEDK